MCVRVSLRIVVECEITNQLAQGVMEQGDTTDVTRRRRRPFLRESRVEWFVGSKRPAGRTNQYTGASSDNAVTNASKASSSGIKK